VNPYTNQYFVLRGPTNYSKWSAHQKCLGTTDLLEPKILSSVIVAPIKFKKLSIYKYIFRLKAKNKNLKSGGLIASDPVDLKSVFRLMKTTIFESLLTTLEANSWRRTVALVGDYAFFLWSISSTFYSRIFCTKVLRAAFFYLHVTREKLPKRLPYKKRHL